MSRSSQSRKAGIIGTGGIAGMGILGMHDEEQIGSEKVQESHAGGYHTSPGIELTAVADIDEGNLAKFGEAWEIPPEKQYVGHRSMLDDCDLDVVSVCTPSYLHHDHVVDVAESSADPDVIWCEKPIATCVADAEEMIEACNDTDTELVVNHSFRFTEKLRVLKRLLDDGFLGEVKSVNAQFRRELMRNSTHLLDMIIYLLDERADHVTGYINGENDAVDSLEGTTTVDDAGGGGIVVTEDGTFITIDCTVAREISSMGVQIIGTEGKLYMNNDDGEWRYWSLKDGNHVEEPIPEIDHAWSWETDYREAFPTAVGHIVDLIDDADDNWSSGTQALRSLEIIVGFYISHYTNGDVDTPLEQPLRNVDITSW